MTLPWLTLPALSAVVVLSSCAQRLPDVADIDRCYQNAEKQAKADLVELDRQRASGQLDDYSYQQRKAAIQNGISQRAIDMAWTNHSLEKTRRESLGIPTADHPQVISVPQAGSLQTGGDYRRFNDPNSVTVGSSQTVSGMLGSSYMPGMAGYGRNRSL